MNIGVTALLIIIFCIGSAAYMAAALAIIIYALGNARMKKEYRITAAIVGVAMNYAVIYLAAYCGRYGLPF